MLKYDRFWRWRGLTAAYSDYSYDAREDLGRGTDRHRWPRVEISDRVAEGMEAAWKLLKKSPCIERLSLALESQKSKTQS